MHCPTCASCQRPKIARPSTLKYAPDLNDKIFVDGVTWTNSKGRDFHVYHVLDQATKYHVAVPAPSRAADQVIQRLPEACFHWAGPPNLIVTDATTEFQSEAFEAFLQRYDVKSSTIAPHAHWQNGRSERHGQILQHMLTKLDKEFPIETFRFTAITYPMHTCQKHTLPQKLWFLVRAQGCSLASSGSETALESADREVPME